ncbi:MAG: argininosuccinate lyase [Cytophagales bacterium]|nr:argininosuccinate lyase [Cytophagales bacterium]
MQKQLWAKGYSVDDKILEFTTGNDRVLDLKLAPYDVLGSLAHIAMLQKIGLLTLEEYAALRSELIRIYHEILSAQFVIDAGVEDIHSQIEFMLTQRLGEVGKKIHSGRSRNDQVLVDMKLYMRDKIEEVVVNVKVLFELLQTLSEKYKNVLLPGYTHYQVAMPSSFGLWFGAYAEALTDDLHTLQAAYEVVNRNPLGSAAGYGSSFALQRQLTTDLLGFAGLNYNVVYAQMTRGKADFVILSSMASVAYTLNKLASDVVLYVSQNFDFISFPPHLMEGSSIMPHKKNPDVFELIRAKTNQIKSLPQSINAITANMPSGYHRDWQLLKEHTLPAFDNLTDCLQLTAAMLEQVIVNEHIIEDKKYDYLFTVERVNELVVAGMPFRDAYKKVGEEIENHTFKPNYKLHHSHEGSIGNIGTEYIRQYFDSIYAKFDFDTKKSKLNALISAT